MTRHAKRILGVTVGAIALIMVTAGASALITREMAEPEKPVVTKTVKVSQTNPQPQPQQQPQPQPQKRCDDGNVVGYGLGAVAGGLIGNQIGDGKGKDVATIGGAAAGALAGGQYIPTRGVLCP